MQGFCELHGNTVVLSFSISLCKLRIDEQPNLQESIISWRFALYFDMCEVQLKTHVKILFWRDWGLFCSVSVYAAERLMCAFVSLCVNGRNQPWRLFFCSDQSDETCGEGEARGAFCKSGRSVLDCERKTPQLCITSDSGAKDMVFKLDSSTLLRQRRQNNRMIMF